MMFDRAQLEEIENLYAKGNPLTEVAKVMDCSPSAVRGALVHQGIQLRQRGAPRGSRTFDEAELQEIVRRYEEGETCARLSTHYGVADSTIYRLLLKRGVDPRRPQRQYVISDEQLIEAQRRYEAGEPPSTIAQSFGCATSTVHTALVDRTKVTKRSRSNIPLERLLRLREAGLPYAEIGRRVGVSGTAVQKRLKR